MFISTTPRLTVSQTSPQSPRFGLGGLIKPSLIDHSPNINDLMRMAHREPSCLAREVAMAQGCTDRAPLRLVPRSPSRRIEVRISVFDRRAPIGRTRPLRLTEPDFSTASRHGGTAGSDPHERDDAT